MQRGEAGESAELVLNIHDTVKRHSLKSRQLEAMDSGAKGEAGGDIGNVSGVIMNWSKALKL